MAAKNKKKKNSEGMASEMKENKTVSHEKIARRAYMLWLEKGGDQLANWLEAEQQLQ